MQPPPFNRSLFLERTAPWLVLVILLAYSYAYFFRVPYAGFNFTQGQVFVVHVPASPEFELRVGDQLLQVGEVLWSEFDEELRQTFFRDVRSGQIVPIRVLRDGQELSINWVIPGPNQSEVLRRLTSGWWLTYVFWLAGTTTLLFLRPKDVRWVLLVIFYYLTSIWLVTGSGPSHWHFWGSAILLRVAIWLCVPVYWHLHWTFPKPFRQLPKVILWLIYLSGISFAIAQWFQLLPRSTYYYAFLLAIGGSLGLLLAHFVFQPEERGNVGLIVVATTMALLPTLGLALVQILNPVPPVIAAGTILALPAIPGAYLYSVFRRKTGALELRVNRAIALYLFLILLGTGFLLSVAMANAWLILPGASTIVGTGSAILACLIGVIGFPRFQRFVERRLLGIPLPPSHLSEAYSARITTSLNNSDLTRLLTEEILPSLLIRQSVLLRIEEDNKPTPLYSFGVDQRQLPSRADIPIMLERSGRYLPFLDDEGRAPFQWIKLILPLRLGVHLVGFWLLGRRDPDDWYSQTDLLILQSIANQTAISLVNIEQAERLHFLYQASIDRQEGEKARLARGIHDEVLNHLAMLAINVQIQDPQAHRSFQEIYQKIVTQLREMVHHLRPAMLTYGLRPALDELVETLSDGMADAVAIELDVPETGIRYSPHVEQHLFRIVQQACENALRHAQAKSIHIQGNLNERQALIRVVDDGVGFPDGRSMTLEQLLMDRHYGLVGMYERAALIGAKLHIASAPGSGTQVIVTWNPDETQG